MKMPQHVARVAQVAAEMPGVIAVCLGGSRALGVHDTGSDWDLAAYYRGAGALDTGPLAALGLGEVHPPGSWGRIMNGGAWLDVAAETATTRVDVLLRDLDVVEHWSRLAQEGRYEVDALLGYVAGAPTYSLLAERALGVVLHGALDPVGDFPETLADAAPPRWRFHARFSLDFARKHAARGDVVGAVGQVAKAVVETAHARVCERRRWVLNEKRLLEAAGLERMHERFAAPGGGAGGLVRWVNEVAEAL